MLPQAKDMQDYCTRPKGEHVAYRVREVVRAAAEVRHWSEEVWDLTHEEKDFIKSWLRPLGYKVWDLALSGVEISWHEDYNDLGED